MKVFIFVYNKKNNIYFYQDWHISLAF